MERSNSLGFEVTAKTAKGNVLSDGEKKIIEVKDGLID